MREIRTSGSEGGGALTGSPYPYEAGPHQLHTKVSPRQVTVDGANSRAAYSDVRPLL